MNTGAAEGFDWDSGNRAKCAKHGVSIEEIESVFAGDVKTAPAKTGSGGEQRWLAVGKSVEGRYVFVVFTMRRSRIRPISARYMHQQEVERYEEDTDS